jgi:hypothetical protein
LLLIGCLLGLASGLCVAAFNKGVCFSLPSSLSFCNSSGWISLSFSLCFAAQFLFNFSIIGCA